GLATLPKSNNRVSTERTGSYQCRSEFLLAIAQPRSLHTISAARKGGRSRKRHLGAPSRKRVSRQDSPQDRSYASGRQWRNGRAAQRDLWMGGYGLASLYPRAPIASGWRTRL